VMVATRQVSKDLQHLRSTNWVEFRSTFLASVLSMEFEERWNAINTRRLDEYMHEVLPGVIKSQGINVVAEQLGRKPSAIEQYVQPKPYVVFIIGRPGSGKTTVAKLIKEKLPETHVYLKVSQVSDLGYLRDKFAAEQQMAKRFERTEDGGFFILDRTLFDEALEDLSAQVLQEMHGHDLVLVEFARQSYCEALQIFAQHGVQPNLIVYVNVDLRTALERNRLRSMHVGGDKHFVSQREMEGTYATDDIEQLSRLNPSKVMIINNEQDMLAGLNQEVLSIIGMIKDTTT
jgi:adenylate kinase family enzyme